MHIAQWVALGELEWIPFAVLRKSIDINLLGKSFSHKAATKHCIKASRWIAARSFLRTHRTVTVWTFSLTKGAARLTQIFLPLVRRANGRIVFLSSGIPFILGLRGSLYLTVTSLGFSSFFHCPCCYRVRCMHLALARVPSPVRGAQCATQAGLEGLATCLRQELRPRGVDVSVVAAGEFAAGTAWLSESTMLEQVNMPIERGILIVYKMGSMFDCLQARNMWSQLSAEQKLNYGEDYFERALRSLEKYTEKVIDRVWNVSPLLALGALLVRAWNRPAALFAESSIFRFPTNRTLIWARPFDA